MFDRGCVCIQMFIEVPMSAKNKLGNQRIQKFVCRGWKNRHEEFSGPTTESADIRTRAQLHQYL